MELVIDANSVFGAIIKESVNYHLLFTNFFKFFSSEYLFVEIDEHKDEIIRKTKKSEDEFYALLEVLKRRINLIPLEELTHYLKKAEQISPDPDDVIYFALALKLNCGIWSNDKALKERQNVVNVYSTEDLMRMVSF